MKLSDLVALAIVVTIIGFCIVRIPQEFMSDSLEYRVLP